MTSREYLHDKQGGECHYCRMRMTRSPYGKYFVTQDHIVPRSKGGSDAAHNLVGACFTCNNMRGDIDYETFMAFIKKHGNTRPIKYVLNHLTHSEYLANRQMYDAIRKRHHDTHIPPGFRRPLPELFATPKPVVPPLPSVETTITYRRPYLYETRRKLESILISMPYRKKQQIWMEYIEKGNNNDNTIERYLGRGIGQ